MEILMINWITCTMILIKINLLNKSNYMNLKEITVMIKNT